MFPNVINSRYTKLFAVLFCAFLLKLHYSTASPNQLRWILAPTKTLVQFVSGSTFTFESYAGYLSRDRTFLIAGACAGVNFLITAFLMLTLSRMWRSRSEKLSWTFIPFAALNAYVATLMANTIRISVALQLQNGKLSFGGFTHDQLHRMEGICVYFGFLMLLYVATEGMSAKTFASRLRLCGFPLSIYYATTLLFPLLNGAYQQGSDFWEHSLFVLLIPLFLLIPSLLVVPFLRTCAFPQKSECLERGERLPH